MTIRWLSLLILIVGCERSEPPAPPAPIAVAPAVAPIIVPPDAAPIRRPRAPDAPPALLCGCGCCGYWPQDGEPKRKVECVKTEAELGELMRADAKLRSNTKACSGMGCSMGRLVTVCAR
ncbi:MAG: hypothetical protein M4D80_16995 [Myxococcota bacterium]|nr:hypothetical protein [Myxococcota bacterium]